MPQLPDGRGQENGGGETVDFVKGLVLEEDQGVGAHRQALSHHRLGDVFAGADDRDSGGQRLLDFQGGFQGVFVVGVQHRRHARPGEDAALPGVDFKGGNRGLGVEHNLGTDDDVQHHVPFRRVLRVFEGGKHRFTIPATSYNRGKESSTPAGYRRRGRADTG